jgi:hypothetical protein
MVEALRNFSAVTTGMHVKIHTDHLNNTVLNQNLKSPDRILRMLLKIESMVHPHYVYLPGRANVVGDGLSRNPKERDTVRTKFKDKTNLLRTLGELLKVVAKASTSTDDADWIVAMAVREADDRPEAWNQVVGDIPVIRAARASRVGVLVGLMVPSFSQCDDDLDGLLKYVIEGNECSIKVEAVATPQIGCPLGTKRWLEPYTNPPWTLKDKRRARMTVLDGVLAVLRLVRDSSIPCIVSHGEGALHFYGCVKQRFTCCCF